MVTLFIVLKVISVQVHPDSKVAKVALLLMLCYLDFLRIHGLKVMSHYDAALYTARRLEMCEIVEMMLFYFLDRPQVHSPLSGLPFMVSD